MTVKFVALVAVPAAVVTEIFPVVAPVGTRVRIFVESKTYMNAFVPLNFTDCTLVKPVPKTLTHAPTGRSSG